MYIYVTADPTSDREITPFSFRAPEVWLELPRNTKVDIWSFRSIVKVLSSFFPNTSTNKVTVDRHVNERCRRRTTQIAREERLRYRRYGKLQAQNNVMGKYPAKLRSRASKKWQAKLEEFDRLDQGKRAFVLFSTRDQA